MESGRSHRWQVVEIALTLGSVIVAGVALWQAHDASEKANTAADKTLEIQEKLYDRSEASIEFGYLQVMLEKPDKSYDYYPESGSGGEVITVPLDEWAKDRDRYLMFDVRNKGTASVYIDQVGLGSSKTSESWAQAGSKWCRDKSNGGEWTENCPRELSAAGEIRYVITLNEKILSDVDSQWQANGIEVCVRLEAYGVKCDRSWARLPDGFLEAVKHK